VVCFFFFSFVGNTASFTQMRGGAMAAVTMVLGLVFGAAAAVGGLVARLILGGILTAPSLLLDVIERGLGGRPRR
jgi:hypothetical protein